MSTPVENPPVETREVASAMVKYGGSFVRALGSALLFADAENAAKIKNAFSDYWQKYERLARP